MADNPLEQVRYIALEHSNRADTLEHLFSKTDSGVIARKVSGVWKLLFPVELVDTSYRLTLRCADSGKFYLRTHWRKPDQSIHFRINGDVMHCW